MNQPETTTQSALAAIAQNIAADWYGLARRLVDMGDADAAKDAQKTAALRSADARNRAAAAS